MLIYYLVLSLGSLLALLFRLTKYKVFLIGSFLLIAFFSGLRYFVGIDYESYMMIFHTIADSSTEPAFRLINLLIAFLGLHVQWVFIISSFLTYFLFYKSIRDYSNDIFLSIFLLLFCGFFIESLNIIRQYIAIAIFFFSIRFIIKRELFKYLVFIALAACFHYSAVLLIIAYFVLNVNYGKLWYLILLGAFVLPFVIPIGSIFGLIPGYDVYFPSQGVGRDDNESANLGIGFLSKLLIGIICVFYYDKIDKVSNESRLYLNGFLIYLFLVSFFRDFIVMVRLGYYFHTFLVLLIPVFVKVFDKKSKPVVYILFLIYGIMILTITLMSEDSKLIPYQFSIDFFK